MYLPENHARLKAAHTYVSEELRALGIPFVSRGAGFFIWVDLRKVNGVELWVEGNAWQGKHHRVSCLLSYFCPPSSCPEAPLRRRGCSGASFWTTRCCCPAVRPSSAKNPAGSGWSSPTRKTGSAWVSSLFPQPPNSILPATPASDPISPVLTSPRLFSGMQRVRQVLERQPQVVEEASPCHTQEPSTQPI